jgi:hypothetical protein
MYQSGSHRNQKIVLYTKDIRLRASSRHGGQGVFLKFLSSIRRGGSPLGSVIFIVNDGERGNNIRIVSEYYEFYRRLWLWRIPFTMI